jgi:hypothetical protein
MAQTRGIPGREPMVPGIMGLYPSPNPVESHTASFLKEFMEGALVLENNMLAQEEIDHQ